VEIRKGKDTLFTSHVGGMLIGIFLFFLFGVLRERVDNLIARVTLQPLLPR
jgi:hypothetical protein